MRITNLANIFSIIIMFPLLVLSNDVDLKTEKSNLIKCSAYHLKAKLNNQYSNKEKYEYHKKYFDTLNQRFLSISPNSSQAGFILSATSVIESWSYIAQENGQRFANMKIETEYKDLCNSILAR
tara:strand:+ start:419 stop:790 length:372 start_codon:yes stop_codon:yes gene_type:complete